MRDELAEFYYAEGRLNEVAAIDSELRKLLAVADPDHPVLVKLNARKHL